MSRCVFLLVLLFGIFRRGLSFSFARSVAPGENITLHCNLSSRTPEQMVWYRQINDELTIIVSATEGNVDKELAVDYNTDPEHFHTRIQNVTGNSLGVSLSLVIVDVRQSDLGLYYCGARYQQTMTFTRAVHLHFPGAVRNRSVQCWTPLISACCAVTLMISLCLGVGYKRGFLSSSCVKRMKNDDVKESDLQYASLRHGAAPRQRQTPPANYNVTYDTVAKKVPKSPEV